MAVNKKQPWITPKESERLKEIVTEVCGSQESFAEAAGITSVNVNRILNGQQEPRVRTFQRMCAVLGKKLDSLAPLSDKEARQIKKELKRILASK